MFADWTVYLTHEFATYVHAYNHQNVIGHVSYCNGLFSWFPIDKPVRSHSPAHAKNTYMAQAQFTFMDCSAGFHHPYVRILVVSTLLDRHHQNVIGHVSRNGLFSWFPPLKGRNLVD